MPAPSMHDIAAGPPTLSLIARVYEPSWKQHCLRRIFTTVWAQMQRLALAPPAVTGPVEVVVRFGSAYLVNLPAGGHAAPSVPRNVPPIAPDWASETAFVRACEGAR